MAAKLKFITDLYGETLTEISNSPIDWMKFLKTASNNYKYSFNDQVLIYAQRPEAKACAGIDTWNRNVGRLVNRGSKGIALIDYDKGYTTLKYVFDISDTSSKYGKSLRLWSVPKIYENDIIESLENKYGVLEKKSNLAETINSVSKIIAEDNMTDYLSDFILYKDNSAFENADNDEIKNVFQIILSNSIAYSIMNRCGINPNEYFQENDFVYVKAFDSYDTITRLGIATSEITEMGLKEIYSTIKKLRVNEIEKIHTFEFDSNKEYDYSEIKNVIERSDFDGNDNLYKTGRLRDTRLSSRNQESEYSSNGEIRNDEIEVFERTEEGIVHNLANGEQINTAFDRDTESSREQIRENNVRNEDKRERDRIIETNKSNEMGSTNEQLESISRRDSDKRTNLYLNNYEKDESNRSFYVVVDEKINQIIAKSPHKKEKNSSIRDYFNNVKDTDERLQYLKNLFNNDYTEIMIDDEMYGYKTFNNGMLFWKGNFLSRNTESFVEWNDLINHIESMILLNQLNDRIEPLKSVTEQLTLVDNYEENVPIDLEFTQEFVDRYLTERSAETKYLIYEEFNKSLSSKSNQEFLKSMYGIGGSSYTISGSGIGEDHNAKGITFYRGYFGASATKQLFKWNYIEKRIKELIKENRYLNSRELEEYPKWLDKKEEEREFDLKVNELSKSTEELPVEYEYHLGDKVYLGADEYEILDIGIANILLYDYRYPLFNREISKEEFDRKIKETPSNDHLIKRENVLEETKKLEIEEIEEPITIEDKTEEKIIPQFEKRKIKQSTTFDSYPEKSTKDRNQYRITDDNLGVDTPKNRFNNNIEAIKILKKCEEENRLATKEEQDILSKYVGWGGLSMAFEENNLSWSNEHHILKNILDESEYNQAQESTLTAFYTPPIVIKAMYKALENMGLKTGNILEPSCGIGNFIGMCPNTLNDCKLYGIELDSISGRIAKQLYQKSSIVVQGYENTNLPNSFFDVAIGNVPFGEFKVLDKKYDKYNFLIHDYFFAKTLDKIRPGGVIAFITSKGTMDKENPNVRRYLAQRTNLLGAIRLPNDTFKDAAGTEVTSDIIFLQKRESMVDIEPDWVYLDTDENGIKMNKYFIDNPDMIMGNMQMVSGSFGMDSACISDESISLKDRLNDAIPKIHAEINEYEVEDIEEEDLSIPADYNVKNFSYALKDGQIYFRENSRMYPQDFAQTTQNRIRGLIEIRDCVRTLIEYQTDDFPEDDIKYQQIRLNRLYDDFTKKYGLINSRGNNSAFSNDSSYYLLCSLEILDENGNLSRKADMFSKRTIRPKEKVTEVDTAIDALIVSIAEKARVDISFIKDLCKMDEEKILSDLEGEIFKVPGEEKYVTADEYLSGNVREKLKIAEQYAINDEKYNINVKYLRKVQPIDLSASEISVRLGSTWIPESVIKDFIDFLLQPSWNVSRNIKVHYMVSTSEWNIEGKNYDKYNVKSYNTYGTQRANAYKIIEDTLNLKDTRIYDYKEDENGRKVAELNKKETAIAQAKQKIIKNAFNEWIWKNPERRERLVKKYNEQFNSIKPREYDGSHISFDGMNPEITLRPHQINAIARILYGGNTLLAHEVGAGKTFEMVAAAMESKRLGLCNKSLFVVPNHIVEQFGQEFLQLYPSANILVTTKKDFETANRKKFCSRIATGDYDAVIISHSQFEKIPMSVERQIELIRREIEDITRGIEELKRNNGEKFSIKQMMKTKKSLETKLAKLNDTSRKDDVVTFEELGVDRIFVDEAHNYKNLYLYTKMRNVGGIAQTEAQKSSDLYMKCRYLDEITGGKGVIFATGTPISNSMVELYTMQRYLQYNELAKRNLQQFDAWASTFGETITAIELSPEGTGYRAKTRFAKFYNLPELMAMFKEVADIQTADMLNLPVPKANYHNIVVEPSEIQKYLVEELANRAERVRNKMIDSKLDNMLKITNDGRKLALDQRLMNGMLDDFEKSKVSTCANNIYDIWNKTKENKSAQLVFCDLSTPHNNGEFNVYDDLKEKLIERGIPKEEIAFIHEANTDVRKQELFNKVRKGQVRVLMGSTQKMGAGTNCQDRLIALHDLDCPWKPSDLIQRSGRIIRQGNMNPEVDIYRYVTEGTFDAYLYQLVENKQRFISQIMTSKTPVRFAEDIDETALSYAEIKALAAGNPLIIEKTELDTQVAKLKLLKQTHLSNIYAMEDKVIKYYPNEIKSLEIRVQNIEDDIEHLNDNTDNTENFQGMIIDEKKILEKKEAGQKIINMCKSMTCKEPIEIGVYKGFKMILSFDTFDRTFHLDLKNKLSYNLALGSDLLGNITRIDNTLGNIKNKLEKSKNDLAETRKQFENAKLETQRPFPQEEELKQKSKRLDELNIQLNLNKNDKEIIDDGLDIPENSENKSKEYDR